MNQEFVQHPTIKNFEASRDGVVRNCEKKKPVGVVKNAGYLKFYAGGQTYICLCFVYEVYNGEIPKGFVVDHIDGNNKNNYVNNLRVLSQSKKFSLGNTGRCKTVTRAIKSIIAITGDEIIFQSINAAGKHFGIWPSSVQKLPNKVTNSAISKKFNQKILFCYISFLILLPLCV